jgi:hypothetical protein
VNKKQEKTKRLSIPAKAPELWPGKWHTTEPLPVFFVRVWGKYLRAGLTLAHIKKLDSKFYNAINDHRQKKLPWPEEFQLPHERNDLKKAIAEFERGNIAALTPKQIVAVGRARVRQAAKLNS